MIEIPTVDGPIADAGPGGPAQEPGLARAAVHARRRSERTARSRAHPGAEAPRPAYPGGAATAWSHAAFLWLNRAIVPIHRAGLSAWMGTPLTGYQLLLRCRGRRSGRIREIPLGYMVGEGAAWLLAGYGRRTEWFRNIEVDPAVELVLPGRVVAGRAVEETDPAIRARIAPALVRSLGVPGMLVGCVTWTACDQRILKLLVDVPLVRVDPTGEPLVAGPDDPGGLAWIWRQPVALALTGWLLRRALRSRSARA